MEVPVTSEGLPEDGIVRLLGDSAIPGRVKGGQVVAHNSNDTILRVGVVRDTVVCGRGRSSN